MPSLKDLRKRITSVRSTRKITLAMKMVAASKLRRAQDQAEAARPYAERMGAMLTALAAGLGDPQSAPRILVGTGSDRTHLLVVATAERGLCGGFNSSIVRAARVHIRELLAAGKTVKILCVGRKGRDMLRRDHASRIVDTVDLSKVRRLGFADAAPVGGRITALFEAGEFDVCTLFYNTFRTVMTQVVTRHQLIPAAASAAAAAPVADLGGASYEFEPDEAEILERLVPRNIAVQIFHALLENAAGEQGARMTAMDSASRNAGEMIDRLTLNYNRTRQAVITKELIEIISGAEAL
ncbi:MAG: F0F1 ATP synthase subunit gamma [Alphaproteobacteria bacterium]|nr:F0F1 ATP synthase subunit gamma [Alphaproteobacteria bacterium]